MRSDLSISASIRQTICDHLSVCLPEEGCGVIGGKNACAMCVIPITNQLHSSTAFRMDAKEQLDAFLKIEENDLELLAIFHSHPDGPGHPSETDIAQNYYPDVVHLICVPILEDNWEIKGFIIEERQVQQIALIWDLS